MKTIPRSAWDSYLTRLRNLSDAATNDLIKYINSGHDPVANPEITKEVIDYAYALTTKYGEASGALAAEMYDALAELSGVVLPAAEVAPTATYGEVAKAVRGTALTGNIDTIGQAAGRLVKMVSVDTMQQNALRDGAEWAWIPSGDTCAFCITLASRGWQPASKKAIKNGHAEHVHANCDCTYCIRHSDDVEVEGYHPETYYDQYSGAEGKTPEEKINAMRREYYQENKEKINAQKRSAYAKRKELNSSAAEEVKA